MMRGHAHFIQATIISGIVGFTVSQALHIYTNLHLIFIILLSLITYIISFIIYALLIDKYRL